MYFLNDLCRLCLVNCTSNGPPSVMVYENDERRTKIKEYLSIDINDRFQICNICDEKLHSFHQFRLSAIRAQHEFDGIISKQQYEQPEYYQSMYPEQIIQDYQYLHLSLDENNVGMIENIYHQIETPAVVEDTIGETTTITEQPSTEMTEPNCIEGDAIVQTDDFSYDDFDSSCQSFPNDRNNIDNAIDQKIEEFIQNKRNKANPKICTICNKLFRTNYKLREHMRTHENNLKFLCDYSGCNKSFKSKIGLKEHMAKHNDEYNYICPICDKKFLIRSYYLAHQKIHSNMKKFSCSICTKTFKSKQNLVNHENFHYGLKNFSCEICQKSFTTKANLDVHIKTSHTQNEQKFECEVCKKLFRTKAYLKVHKRTHFKDLQNYICTICKKTFIQLCDLKIHAKTHTNQKDFICEICGERFTRKDSLKLHVSSIHKKETLFTCKFCQKLYNRKSSFNQHAKKCTNRQS